MSEIRKITLQFPSLRAFLDEYGERISVDGMLLRADSPPADGSTVEVEVVVADGMRLLSARGDVLWGEAGEAGGRPKAAVLRFRYIDDASRVLIGKIVEQRQREGAEPFNLDDVLGTRGASLHDLTVPAAAASVPPSPAVGVDEGSVFDLAQPPQAAASDLFSPPSEEDGRPPPPVPLLADSGTTPFDLPPGAAMEEGEIDDGGLPLEPTPPVDEDPGATVRHDLSDLFGADEPLGAPARERTEAFPPSFLDEVEAELKAADDSATATSPEEIGEFEIPLGVPVEEPGTLPAAEPTVESEPALEIESAPEAEVAIEPTLPAEPASAPDETLQAARAFNAEHGLETVEIPLVTRQPAAEPVPPAEPAVAASESPPAPPIDDNLLTIPELGMGRAPAKAPDVPAVTADLPSSAQSLRGAASSSRHLGTWLLIAMLAAALGVAGYFLLGLMRGGGDTATAELPAGVPDPEPGPSAGTAPAAGDSSADGATEATVATQVTEEAAAAAAEPTAVGGDAAAAAVDPTIPAEPTPVETVPATTATPLTGLNRITWSESGDETVLALIGDGEFSSEQVELVPITGGQPRLVIKIRGVERPFQPAVLEVETSHVLRVRTGLHAGGELHVVVDLAAPGVSVRDFLPRGARLEVRFGGL